jgi:hypothetical protein
MKKLLFVLALLTFITGCDSDAYIASRNLSEAADNFQITRRIIFYNGITSDYILSIEGRCSIFDEGHQLEVTCKTGNQEFKKHFLGLSDNVTYFAEQIESANVSSFHYKVTFKPETILPDIDLKLSNESNL